MSDKKHIDRLFQEKFKDFEAVPNNAVWENIKSKLNKKKDDDKIIPIWWRYVGIAALLLIFMTIGGLVFFDGNDAIPSTKVVDSEKNIPENNINNSSTIKESRPNNDIKNEVVSSDNQISEQPHQENTVTGISGEDDNIVKNNSNLIKDNNSLANTPSNNNAVAEISSTKEDIKNDESLKKVASNKNSIEINGKEAKDVNNNVIANSEENSYNTNPQTAIVNIKKNNTDNFVDTDVFAEIAKNEVVQDNAELNKTIVIDSLSIEEEIAKTEDIIEEEKSFNRWSISPNVAPVYFNSLGKGSSIDAQFNDNSKSGEINMSYGIVGSYAISEKLTVRTGINKVNLGYNTNDILVLETTGKGPNSALLNNVSIKNDESQMSLVSAKSLVLDRSSNVIDADQTGSINQNIGYIEIPFELQYNLLNKKIGINVIGGFSSFFLNENKLYSEVNSTSTFIGEANNVNKVSYSANFGLGLNYNFSRNINLNLEPIFKYQINTFSNISGEFKPYFVGFYTGFSFKF